MTERRVTTTLPAGQLLTVVAAALSVGPIIRLADTPGGGDPFAPVPITAGQTLTFGPYTTPRRYAIVAVEGEISTQIGPPNAAVIASPDVEDVEVIDPEEDDPATIAASLADTQTQLNAALGALRTAGILT